MSTTATCVFDNPFMLPRFEKIVIIDPHTSDFIYRPVSYWITRKRPLLKYKHLAGVFSEIFYTGRNSSLPSVWTRRLPLVFRRFLVWLECVLWERLNRVSAVDSRAPLGSPICFTFGYKNLRNVIDELKSRHFEGVLFVHLSHYHGFSNIDFRTLGFRLIFCGDNDVSEHEYFKSRFPDYRRPICILPFSVDQRFFSGHLDETDVPVSVAVTGTVHMMPDRHLPFHYSGYSTLHPIRLAIFLEDKLPSYVRNELSLFNSHKGIVTKIFEQRNYYKRPIVEIYRECTHSVVASEGNGLVAIGLLESMAVGLIPIVSSEDYCSLRMDAHDVDVLVYRDYPHLLLVLNELAGSRHKKSKKNRAFSARYLAESLAVEAEEQLVTAAKMAWAGGDGAVD